MTNLLDLRLQNQHIARQWLKKPAAVVGWMGAIQGQDYPGAKWSIGLRLPGSTAATIEQAIADKHILRTWAMRGTLHFVVAEDIGWMVALIAPGIIRSNARRYRQLELDDKTMARSSDVIANALDGGKLLTRRELFEILEKRNISTKGQRGVYMLQRASLDGLVCQGVMEGHNNPSFMRMPKGKRLASDEAAVELAHRYFVSRGPATLKDFTWWSGLGAGNAKAGFEAIQSELAEVKIDGAAYRFVEAESTGKAEKSATYLLPGFDEYLLGYSDRSAVLDPQHANKIWPGGGTFHPAVVAHGQVVGRWKSALKKGEAVITPELFGDVKADALAAAAKRYGDYLGVAARINVDDQNRYCS